MLCTTCSGNTAEDHLLSPFAAFLGIGSLSRLASGVLGFTQWLIEFSAHPQTV
jgi:hypothetical protein